MSAIASSSGVSKALLHYHYTDRSALLAEVALLLGERVVARERAAMDAASGSGSVDALWFWLQGELALGELRALLELGLLREDAIRTACARVAIRRHIEATHTIDTLFERLGLTPRLPAPMLGRATVAFVDGLAAASRSNAGEPRVSFDVFWLALLGLAE